MIKLKEKEIIIDKNYEAIRLDKAISSLEEDLSRVAIQRMIENENILVNEKKPRLHIN